LVRDLRRVTADVEAALIVAGDLDLAVATGADGVHLAADDPWPTVDAGARLQTAAPRGAWVSRSCHSIDELVAARGRADWATFSPVFATASKPGYGPALGVAALSDGHRRVPDLPIVALGGIDPTTARSCVAAGAAAVAVMGAVMRADDPAAVVARLRAEVRAGCGDRAGSVHA
jgi:thiamine-phosphate pyrophosphorylase